MKTFKNRTKFSLIVLTLLLISSVSFALLPAVLSQTPGTKQAFALIDFIPNPVGVGQTVLITVGITDDTTYPQLGWEGITVTVEKPDGTTETLGPVRTDTTGLTGITWVPNQVGTHYLQTNFPEQTVTAEEPGRTEPVGTIILAAKSEKAELIVQQDPIQYYPGHPLPAQYWTRPIDPHLREWQTISGHWLYGKDEMPNKFVPFNDDAPEAPHILWRRTLATGGLSGGTYGDHSFETGDAYEGKFEDPVIIAGVLYYNRYAAGFLGMHATQGIYAVDIHTGEELWFKNNTRLSFGQILQFDSYNYHGSFAYLWEVQGSTWNAYDPLTGEWLYSFENVPSGGVAFGGSLDFGPNGEILRYTINTQNGWMTLWNSTKVVMETAAMMGPFFGASWGGNAHRQTTFNATLGIMWNVTIPKGLPGSPMMIMEGDRIIGTNIQSSIGNRQPNPVFWAISLRPGQRGTLLYNTTWNLPVRDLHVSLAAGFIPNADDRVFLVVGKETRQYWGFSADTGKPIWGPTDPLPPLTAFSISYPAWNIWGQGLSGYGKFVAGGMGGVVACWDVKTGEELWRYPMTDPYQEILWSNYWPAQPLFITDGKVYVTTTEHSPIDPKPRGGPFVCLDIETGEEIFRVNGFLRGTRWGSPPIIGDSIIVGDSTYDNQIYAVGKGPSATTVTAPDTGVSLGSSVMVRGTVMDISPGTKYPGLMMRFPNGVPAVADEDMGDWMQHVYLQFAHPTDAKGVPVTIDVIDANGNYRNIGTATSDTSGFFKFAWTPDIPGEYTVIATFAGSKSYWPSYAETAFVVDEAPKPPPTAEPVTLPPVDLYILYATVAIIATIVIIGVLILRKK